MKDHQKVKYTSIGGQAVIEGIMMRGPEKTCIAVRQVNGEIEKEISDTPKIKNKFLTLPFVRGTVNLFSSLKIGYQAIEYSANFFEDEEDYKPSKFEAWLEKKAGDKFNRIVMVFSMILGLILSIGLFIMLPTVLTGFLKPYFTSDMAGTLIEGLFRIVIFLLYIYLIGLMPDIKRVFQYHGAEHKTIHCYEHNEELTVENIQKYKTLHPRCGTAFLLIVMIVSILVFSLLSWQNVWLRMLFRLLLLPVVVGISYELLKLGGKYDNPLTRILIAPGLYLQKLTTAEPDDSMIEVAVAAMKECIPSDGGDRA